MRVAVAEAGAYVIEQKGDLLILQLAHGGHQAVIGKRTHLQRALQAKGHHLHQIGPPLRVLE
ncbi:hypothetical protein QT17_03330 [Thermus sp. 2.9]|nr:hypothetical protein QT17_03330 [Thermus sp. 2.9]